MSRLQRQGEFTPSRWIAALLRRHQHLGRELLQNEARSLRARFSQRVEAKSLDPRVLPPEWRDILPNLDLPRPYETVGWSMAITNQAIRKVSTLDKNAVHTCGLICALTERELWDLPEGRRATKENLALAKLGGIYFTPPNIAWYITVRTLGPMLAAALATHNQEAITRASRTTVLDPACGAGIFLVCALEVLLAFWDEACTASPSMREQLGSRRDYARRLVRSQLFGFDLSLRAVLTARKVLATVAGCTDKDIRGIEHGNSLTGPAPHDPEPCPRMPKSTIGERSLDLRTLLPQGGVQIVLLNPPFGRLRVLKSDFTEKSRAFRLTETKLERLFAKRKKTLESLATFFRNHPGYSSALGGVLDWQRLFLVRSVSLLTNNGRLGAIVPAAIVADRTSSRFRQYLFEHTAVDRIDRLQETAKLFPCVNQPTCIIVTGKGKNSDRFRTNRPVRTLPISGIDSFVVNVPQIRKYSPSTLAIPDCDLQGWRILAGLQRNGTVRSDNRILNLRGECDLTIFGHLVGTGSTRLIRGDHIERFRVRGPEQSQRLGLIDVDSFRHSLGSSRKKSHLGRRRLVGRQCAFLEKKRRMSFALVEPNVVVANSCNYLLWNNPDADRGLLFLCGLLNSVLMEWRFRLTSSNNHVNNYEIDDLPIPPGDPRPIINATRPLIYRYSRVQFGTSASGNGDLEDILDATVFRAFSVARDDVRHVVSSLAPHRLEGILGAIGPQ